MADSGEAGAVSGMLQMATIHSNIAGQANFD
jgi:hypothetical protein